MKKFYQLEQTDKKADLYIFGKITAYDWNEKEKSAYSIVKELQELEVDELNVHINSLGGSVSEGLAIYNTLKNSDAKITTICDGFACSAASVIFMAGDVRIMNEASLLMIHNAWTFGQGNAQELRKQADDLERITQASVNAYVRNSIISEEEIKKMMDDETWISACQAKEYGFATKIYEEDDDVSISQSAMQIVHDKILQTSVRTKNESLDKIANQIAEKVTENLKVKEEGYQKDDNSWNAFFGKGE